MENELESKFIFQTLQKNGRIVFFSFQTSSRERYKRG